MKLLIKIDDLPGGLQDPQAKLHLAKRRGLVRF